MPLFPEDIEFIEKLVYEGKIEDLLQFYTNIEKREDLSPEDKLRLKIIKARTFQNLQRFNEALKLVEEAYRESEELEKPLLLIDAIFIKFLVLISLGHRKGFWKDVVYGEKLLKTAIQEPTSEIEARKALLNNMKGHIYRIEYDLDLALKFFKKSIAIMEKLDLRLLPNLLPFTVLMIGVVYQAKGELDLALNYYKKWMEFPKPKMGLLNDICLNQIGAVYFQKGDTDQAIEYSKRSLKTLEQVLSYNYTGTVYLHLILGFLENNDIEQAQEYLQRFQKYIDKSKRDENFPWYKLAKSLILTSSSRTRDRAEAETLLKEVIKLSQTRNIGNIDAIGETNFAIAVLCDLYLTELHSTNNMKILDDIQPLIRKLLKNVEHAYSYTGQVTIYFFQGQLALLQMNMGDARRYLTKAQKIADDHGLQFWARKISHEHDKLLEKMDEWENLRKRNISIRERMDLISIEQTVDIILQKRGIRPPELIDEIPMLLLIIAEGGIPIFSKSFTEEKDLKEEFISKFLTAFNTFSEQFFSEGLDRATFGNYTLVIASINSFSLCYLFKGQSYVAKQKLTRFTETLQNNELLWQIFENFDLNNQAIKLSENASLESLITEIFIRKTIQITEKEVVIQKEKKICLVCKSKVVKFFYICECGAIYCEKCARAISDLENLCWACNVPIDYSKPVKSIKKVVREDIKKNL